MTLFQLSAVFITLVALGGWVNARTLDLPREVAMLLVGLTGALALWAVQRFDPGIRGTRFDPGNGFLRHAGPRRELTLG